MAFRDEIVATFESEVGHPQLRLQSTRTPPTSTKCAPGFVEWLIATAVVVHLTKPYFEEFLKEAGKDHYRLLKAGIKGLWQWIFHPARQAHVRERTLSGLARDSSLYSRTFSVLVELDSWLTIKLLIRDAISENVFAAQIDKFMDDIQRLHSGEPNVVLRDLIDRATPVGSTIFVTYDAYTETLTLVDPIVPATEPPAPTPRRLPPSPSWELVGEGPRPSASPQAALRASLDAVVTFAGSLPLLRQLLEEGVVGEGKYVAVGTFELAEFRACRALTELARTIQAIEVAGGFPSALAEIRAHHGFGVLIQRDGSQKALLLDELTSTILTAARIDWRAQFTRTDPSPAIICTAAPQEPWSESIIDLLALESFCRRLLD
ncbi:MAG: hypothetical protein WDO68_17670 [Gammaproteobacteria bacterium]